MVRESYFLATGVNGPRALYNKYQLPKISTLFQENFLGGKSKGVSGIGVNSGIGGSSKTSPTSSSKPLDALMHFLNQYLKMMTVHGVDQDIVNQVFKQTFYYIGASCLNNLLLRKEMCHWSRGMQIRFNLSHLEQWIVENKLQVRFPHSDRPSICFVNTARSMTKFTILLMYVISN